MNPAQQLEDLLTDLSLATGLPWEPYWSETHGPMLACFAGRSAVLMPCWQLMQLHEGRSRFTLTDERTGRRQTLPRLPLYDVFHMVRDLLLDEPRDAPVEPHEQAELPGF